MPQFDVEYYFAQIFWLVIIFFAFYWILKKGILPKFERILEARSEKIEALFTKAKDLEKKAVELRKSTEKDLTASKAEAQYIISAMAQKVKKEHMALQKEFDAKLVMKQKEADQKFNAIEKDFDSKIETSSTQIYNFLLKELELSNNSVKKK